jgi:hypothetical protein
MGLRQRERGSGSAAAVPSYIRVQDGDGTLLADVVARPDGVNALCVDTEMTFYSDNVTINNVKNAVYLATLATKTTAVPEFLQLSQYGGLLVSDVDVHEGSDAFTWNTDGTVDTIAITIQGKTFTRTYVWNADGTPQSSSVAVT